MILRPYQETAFSDVQAWFSDYKGPGVVVAPTAWGKSLLTAKIAEKYGRTLVFQPSKELLDQNFRKYEMLAGDATIFSASFKSKEKGNVTFATIGSIKNPKDFNDFEYLVVDEAHLFPTEDSMYARFILANPQLKVIGLTATPFRLERGLFGSKLFSLDSNKYTWKGFAHICQIQDILDWWCPIEYSDLHGDQSLLKVNSTGSEYTERSLEIYAESLDSQIRNVLEAVDEPMLVFVPSIDQANHLARKLGGKAISAKTPTKERKGIIDWFKNGEGSLFNVNLLGIGFDYPELRNILDANPTMSLARYYQKVGRLTRQHPSKTVANYYDLSGNYLRFGRVEDLVIRRVRRSTHVFSGDIQLTGVFLNELPNVVGYQAPTEMLMPFGKYKGYPVSNVPVNYLQWGVDNDIWKGPLKDEIHNLLNHK